MGLQSFLSSAALYRECTFLFPHGMNTGASFTICCSDFFFFFFKEDAYFQPLFAKLFVFVPNNFFFSSFIQPNFLPTTPQPQIQGDKYFIFQLCFLLIKRGA